MLRLRTTLIAVFLLVSGGVSSSANGKFFWPDTIPPGVPYQRAILWYGDGLETLLLQSQYELPGGADSTTAIGWVVPVPAVPEVASMPADMAQDLFFQLAWISRPDVVEIGPFLLLWLILILSALVVACLLLALLSFLVPLPVWLRSALRLPSTDSRLSRRRLGRYAAVLLFVWALLVLSTFFRTFSAGAPPDGVSILAEEQVGAYHVRVIASEDASDLITWLNEREFEYSDEDAVIFDAYVSAGWCFVVANVSQSENQRWGEVMSEGLLAPLILRFPSDSAVYPLALTSTVGRDTEVLLYVIGDHKLATNSRLPLRFAEGGRRLPLLGSELRAVEPEGFFGREDELTYLSKFRGTLTPEEMAEDLYLTAASENEPFNERVWRWW